MKNIHKYMVVALMLAFITGCANNTDSDNKPYKNATNNLNHQTEKSECDSNSDCVRGGCSGTLCHSPGNDIITTCEYLPEYECYNLINCGCIEGKCGWEESHEFDECINEKKSRRIS